MKQKYGFLNAWLHQGFVVRVCVCAGRVMGSGICCVSKDRTVTAYWMEMNVRYEEDWQC